MLPKDGMRPQLVPEHEMICLSSSETRLLYECKSENESIDPVKLDLCDYQAIEPIHFFDFLKEEKDIAVMASPYEALDIQGASKIDAPEDLPNPVP